MNSSKWFLAVSAMTFLLSIGCVNKKRIEGAEVPTMPPANEVVVPPTAPPPPAVAEVPPAPEAPPAPEPTAVPTQEAAAPPPPVENPCNKYIVVKGDTLWDISGSGSGYHDNFQWPLIFKANRDKIQDPDLIYPKQDLEYKKEPAVDEVSKAKKAASDTPKFKAHKKARKKLSVDYF